MSKEFKLSSVLFGHSLDVRCVVVLPDNSVLSGSRDKTAKLWRPNEFNTSYSEVMSYKDSKNFIITVLYLDPCQEYPDGLVITGGNDNAIYVYKPFEPFATFIIKEHTNAVCCLSKALSPNCFISGSWDTTAKYWNIITPQKSILTLSGHSAAIWAVVQLKDGRILTGSADKTIGMWTGEGLRIHRIDAHNDCIRGLLDCPDKNIFISVSNDATVKIWKYNGENIDTLYGHENYIYSIARRGENGFVTSDESRTVKVWENGVNTHTILLPAQSVWSVACLKNGDIVTGNSDGVVRIFTQNSDRYADELTLNKFNEEVEALSKQALQSIGGYKVSDLPGKEALYDPGKKAGQMKIIREEGQVVAYTWVKNGSDSHWEKVGEVLGGTDKDKQDKTMFEGKSYDFVFTVDIEDGKPPLKLPYNRGDDVYKVANEFLTKNMLPQSYLEQTVDFILKNSGQQQYTPQASDYVDPFTGGSRYTPSTGGNQSYAGVNVDPFTGGSSYSTAASKSNNSQSVSKNGNADPFTGSSSYTTLVNSSEKYFPQSKYKTFDMGDVNVILGKLKEFNKKIGDNNDSLDDVNLQEIVKLCSGPPENPTTYDLLFKLLDWPDDIIFPVLDVVRLAVRHQKNNEVISSVNNGIIIKKLLAYLNENCKTVNNLILSLRTLCNLFSHEQGENLVFENRFDILEQITSLGSLNKNGQVALITFLLNLSIASLKKNDDLALTVLGDVIPDILTRLTDPESLFRGYVALGTLLISTTPQQLSEIKEKIKSNGNFFGALQLHLLPGQSDLEMKKVNCAKQVQALIN